MEQQHTQLVRKRESVLGGDKHQAQDVAKWAQTSGMFVDIIQLQSHSKHSIIFTLRLRKHFITYTCWVWVCPTVKNMKEEA